VNLCDYPRISDYNLIYTLLHINWKWLNDRMSYMLKCLHLRPDRRTVTLSSQQNHCEITCWWCCYVHHRPNLWRFSDKVLRNLMPWFCREFAAIFVTFFNCLPRFLSFFYRDFLMSPTRRQPMFEGVHRRGSWCVEVSTSGGCVGDGPGGVRPPPPLAGVRGITPGKVFETETSVGAFLRIQRQTN